MELRKGGKKLKSYKKRELLIVEGRKIYEEISDEKRKQKILRMKIELSILQSLISIHRWLYFHSNVCSGLTYLPDLCAIRFNVKEHLVFELIAESLRFLGRSFSCRIHVSSVSVMPLRKSILIRDEDIATDH